MFLRMLGFRGYSLNNVPIMTVDWKGFISRILETYL
jgi:hypothetical protein